MDVNTLEAMKAADDVRPAVTGSAGISEGVEEHKGELKAEQTPTDTAVRKTLQREGSMIEYDVGADYLELILQYG
jgi:hypothetical protein